MSLKSFIKSIGKFFSKLFKGLAPELKKAVHIGVTITDAMKNYDETHPGFIDLWTAIIPGDWDDKLKDDIRKNLPDAMVKLRLVNDTLNLTDPNEIMAVGIKTLQSLKGKFRSTTLNDASFIIADIAADGKLDWNDAAYLMKWYYDHKDSIDIDTTL